jgi:tetratricopeptide (TPR) repeat protein
MNRMVGRFASRAGLFAFAFVLLLPIQCALGADNVWSPAYIPPPGQEDLIIQVARADGEALQGTAKICLTTRQAASAEVVATPQQHHRAKFSKVPLGPSRLQVSSEGFAPADLKVLLDHAGREMKIVVYLRPEAKAGANWIPALSASASSSYAKIVDSLRKGNINESQKNYAKLRKSIYGHPHVQYVAGLVDYRSQETGLAVFHFSQAAYLNPEYEDSSRALGGLFYHNGIYSDAYEVFAQIARRHPEDWEPAWQAASAAFHAARYSDARDYASLAWQRGGQVAGRAQVLLALSDALMKNWEDAQKAASTYLVNGTDPALTSVAQDLLAAMGPIGSSGQHALPPERAAAAVLASDAFDPRIPARLWAPPDVDDQPPAMVEGPACNLAEVLALAGQHVDDRFKKLEQVGATQHIEQAVMDVTGRVMPLHHFTLDYLADVHPMPDGNYAVDEFHGGVGPIASPSSPPVAHGVAALALVFSPILQPDFNFVCEGLTNWKDQPAWSVHFSEDKQKPARLHSYIDSGRVFPVYIRGRALIEQSTGEILRVESDMQDPVAELRLEEEHMIVDYMPVTFHGVDEPFYLPSQAEVFIHFRGHLYRIKEEFDKYIRFAVNTRQQIKAPKERAQPPGQPRD